MRAFNTLRRNAQRGFTLVEMIVVAPIVILLIGAFIALIVNLTGEVLSSRGSNVLAYDLQNTLNRIEQDVKLSTTYLAASNITTTTTKQGYGGTTTTGGTATFTNVDKTATGGSPASLVLNALATNGNPLSNTSGFVYLADKPNSCDTYDDYSKNTPMTMNIVYFVQNNTLWRRVIMPADYDNAAIRCGNAAWQVPTCINGYAAASLPFCKANDERMVDGVSPSDFAVNYYAAASSTTPDSTAANQAITNDATRNTALQSTPTVEVSITSNKTIAGRDISRTSTVRVTRLDTNASSIAQQQTVTSAPAAPSVSGTVSDGHNVTFTWPRVAGATSYNIDYCVVAASVVDPVTHCTSNSLWQTGATNVDNNSRSYVVTSGGHTDKVAARVRASNSFGPSAYGTQAITIPLWAPLLLKGNWTDYSATFAPASYTKTKDGFVLIKGLVKNGGTPVIWETIGSLPGDYAPSGTLIFSATGSSNVAARVNVYPTSDGANVQLGNDASGAWLGLDTIRYVAADAGYTRNALTLQNGYSNYGGGYATAAWVQDASGRISIEGLLTGGTRTVNTVIASLPAAATPNGSHLVHSWSNGIYTPFGVQASPSAIVARTGATGGWYSINTSYLPSASSATWTNLTFQNSWANYGGSYATGQYTKTADNVVQLKGLIRLGTNTYDTTIATLPAGFRPKNRLLLTTIQNSDAHARIDILPDGQIRFMGSNNGYYSLSNIQFMAEQ